MEICPGWETNFTVSFFVSARTYNMSFHVKRKGLFAKAHLSIYIALVSVPERQGRSIYYEYTVIIHSDAAKLNPVCMPNGGIVARIWYPTLNPF
eukprot:scaffold1048_cov90-Amphora_coffeaeformis.AAC.38